MKIKDGFRAEGRKMKSIEIDGDLAIVGGGLSGVCTALTAARQGLKVVLVQDRSVLGGNASSEVRLWVLGATSHMGNNNRWAREGGVIDEILVENTYKNKEGNPIILDMILLDKVVSEPNITLLLNTTVYDLTKSGQNHITSIKGVCSQNSTTYTIKAPLFCDSSGDGILGFLSGAAFRMGAEKMDEFGEKFAPSEEYGELLGHSLYFYSKDTGMPVNFTAPEFALDDIETIPRFKSFNSQEYGCKLWWIEYGGRLDTVHDTEKIKWELWKVVYGVWDYIKNSGNFPDAENLTLEWVGMIPGKRESRRFEGDYMLKQQDLVEQKSHADAVAFGGWSIDLHPADGVFSEKPGCNQWHGKGIYQIPYRSLYSKNIDNLFFTGRIISATHVAFASTRVMATGAHMGQAVGMAAKLAIEKNLLPRDIYEQNHIPELQKELLKKAQFIPNIKLIDDEDLARHALISASSNLVLSSLPESDIIKPLEFGTAQILPLKKGKIPEFELFLQATDETELEVELRVSSKLGNHTPDVILERQVLNISPAQKTVHLRFESELTEDRYVFLILHKNPAIHVTFSEKRVSGIISVFNHINKAVSNFGKQTPPDDIGVEEFEFWCPQRRPEGYNLAMNISPGLDAFDSMNVCNGIDRPVDHPNAWVVDNHDTDPWIELTWEQEQDIARIDLMFDVDFDHPMETVLMSHPESVMPFCVRDFSIYDDRDQLVHEEYNNYQSLRSIALPKPISTSSLKIKVKNIGAHTNPAVFAIRCYKED